jgi:hypothetical protein
VTGITRETVAERSQRWNCERSALRTCEHKGLAVCAALEVSAGAVGSPTTVGGHTVGLLFSILPKGLALLEYSGRFSKLSEPAK